MGLSNLANLTTAATSLSNLILVSPQKTIGYQPQNLTQTNGVQPQGPPLLFHYEGEQAVVLTSDITDHFVEDNTSIQDQIALKPVVITTKGYIGELNDVPPLAILSRYNVAQKLTQISAYSPALSVTALNAYNEALFLYQTAISAGNAGVSTWNSINGSGGENVITDGQLLNNTFNNQTGVVTNSQNKQQVAFQQFFGYYSSRTLFTVQTPWAVFQNCAIQSLRAVQDETTNVITDFEVTFKQMRFAKTQLTGTQQGRAAAAAADLTNNGVNTPNDVGTPGAAVPFFPSSAVG